MRQARVPALRVRYEDILGTPAQVADRTGPLLNLDLRTIGSAIEKGRRIPVGHLRTTGPSPMGRDIRLSPCLEWKTRLGRWDRRIFRFLAGETAGKFGTYIRSVWTEGKPDIDQGRQTADGVQDHGPETMDDRPSTDRQRAIEPETSVAALWQWAWRSHRAIQTLHGRWHGIELESRASIGIIPE